MKRVANCPHAFFNCWRWQAILAHALPLVARGQPVSIATANGRNENCRECDFQLDKYPVAIYFSGFVAIAPCYLGKECRTTTAWAFFLTVRTVPSEQ